MFWGFLDQHTLKLLRAREQKVTVVEYSYFYDDEVFVRLKDHIIAMKTTLEQFELTDACTQNCCWPQNPRAAILHTCSTIFLSKFKAQPLAVESKSLVRTDLKSATKWNMMFRKRIDECWKIKKTSQAEEHLKRNKTCKTKTLLDDFILRKGGRCLMTTKDDTKMSVILI